MDARCMIQWRQRRCRGRSILSACPRRHDIGNVLACWVHWVFEEQVCDALLEAFSCRCTRDLVVCSTDKASGLTSESMSVTWCLPQPQKANNAAASIFSARPRCHNIGKVLGALGVGASARGSLGRCSRDPVVCAVEKASDITCESVGMRPTSTTKGKQLEGKFMWEFHGHLTVWLARKEDKLITEAWHMEVESMFTSSLSPPKD